MRRALLTALILIFAAATQPALAHDHQEQKPAPAPAAAPAQTPPAAAPAPTPAPAPATPAPDPANVPTTGAKGEIYRIVKDNGDKLVALAEATPPEKYTWRPADRIRTVGEVFMHVAAANYFLPTIYGTKIPQGVNPMAMENEAGDKAKVVQTLKDSFAYALNVIATTPDADYDKPVKIFGQDGSIREVFLHILSHSNEHLGQSIAYARMSGTRPPWSM